MEGAEPRAKRQKMAASTLSAAVPVTAYRYNENNVFSLLLQSGGLEIPIIFDSKHTFAVLDKYPLTRGHALLIAKHPAATLLDDLPPEAAQAIFLDLQSLTRALQRATNCAGLQVRQHNGPAAGQTVPQLHFHIIPIYDPQPSPTSISTSLDTPRAALSASEAGPLLAHLRNLLPPSYAPGYHVWAPSETQMEALGWALAQSASAPGTVLALSGQLGAGKSTISRGFVRAFVADPLLEVPSPTFLLCLTYQDDHAYDKKTACDSKICTSGDDGRDGEGANGGVEAVASAAVTDDVSGSGIVSATQEAGVAEVNGDGAAGTTSCTARPRAAAVHHLDPYRLGAKNDKMAGLIDFESAFRRDVCLIEWPHRMPAAVMELAGAGLALEVSGMGVQASGRLVSITPLGNRFKPPPPKPGKAANRNGSSAAPTSTAASAAAASDNGGSAASGPPPPPAAATTPTTTPPSAVNATEPAPTPTAGPTHHDRHPPPLAATYEQLLSTWRQDVPDRMPPADVVWRGTAATAEGAGGASLSVGGGGGGTGAAAGGGSSTINPAAAAAIAAGDPSKWVVLGIESSCDDTAAAVVRGDGTVLSHQVASQTGLHEQYGGVKPDVARQAHAAAIQATVDSALSAAGVSSGELTAVAVTAGPGLALCLQVGVQHGLSLAARHGLPYIPVHHMEAHALMTRLPSVNTTPMVFPSLLLLVSGGHNMLVLCEGVGRHRIVGTTLDDSVGECFDKIARMAGISAVPGGPHLERLAATAAPDAHIRYPLTLPLANGAQKDSCNFSFSGLKTQVVGLLTAKRRELGLPDLPPPPALAALQLQPQSTETQSATAPAAAAPGGESAVKGSGGPGQSSGSMEAPSEGISADGAGGGEGGTRAGGGVGVEVVGGGQGEGSEVEVEAAARRAAAEAEFTTACADIAASFQRTAVRFLQQRTRRALQWLREDAQQQLGAPRDQPPAPAPGQEDGQPSCGSGSGATAAATTAAAAPLPGFVRALVVAGGVAANTAVRKGLSEVAAEFGLPCVYPPVKYCTDNGLMVAWTGVERLGLGLYSQPPRSCEGAGLDAHVQVIPRWPIGPMDPRSTANKGRAHIKILH